MNEQEDYESIKNQLNGFISELSAQKSLILLDAKFTNEKPFINKKEENAFKTIIKSKSFKKALEEAKSKLDIDYSDDHDFLFTNKETALNALMQVVVAARALADPYGENISDEEYEKLVAEKGEDMWWVYAGLGEERAEELKNEIENIVNEVLLRSGMPKTWFQYVVSCLLGTDFLNYHIKVDGEHKEKLQVTNAERDFIDLRIYKGIEKEEFYDCWKALEDYLTHNVPAGLVRVKNEGARMYNDKINGVRTSDILKEYRETHQASLNADRSAFRVIESRKKYKKLKI